MKGSETKTIMKSIIIQEFEKLRKKEVANKEVWKARAYAKVVKQLTALPHEVRSMDDLMDLTGIGQKTREKIMEIFETGALEATKAYNADETYQTINELIEVHGIGPAKANDLVHTHGVQGIADLRNKINLLNDTQVMGLKYYDDFRKRIPRREMDRHAAYIDSVIKQVNPKMVGTIVGSYRRGAASSGDIDVIISAPAGTIGEENEKSTLDQIVTKLKTEKYIVDILAQGGKKFMGVCRVKHGRHFRRLDMMITQSHEYPFASLYFTGSAEFNTKLRAWVLANKAMSLSEYGLKVLKTGELLRDVVFETEADVFSYLGLRFIEPSKRTPEVVIA